MTANLSIFKIGTTNFDLMISTIGADFGIARQSESDVTEALGKGNEVVNAEL